MACQFACRIHKRLFTFSDGSADGSSGGREAFKLIRQIKNIVAIAQALATKKNTKIIYSHLRQALKASEGFIRKFNGLNIVEVLYLGGSLLSRMEEIKASFESFQRAPEH